MLANEVPEPRPQPWLSEEDYQELESHVRLKLNGVFQVFNVYGQKVFIDEAIEAVMQVMRWYGLKLRGVDDIPPEMLLYLRGKHGGVNHEG